MSSTNSGPAQTQTQNMQPLAGTFNADGTPAAIVGPGGVVVTRPFDPSSVAITGGVIGAGVRIAGINPSLNDYGPSNPLYIAHRGSDALYPEESSVAYNRSLADGEFLLECDVQTLSDGSLGLMHDGTVDRTTTGTGNVSTFSASTFKALTMDSSAWLGSNYGDTLNPMLFQEFIDAYKGRAILVPEDKDFSSMTAMVRALINSGVPFDQALVQCFTASNLATAVNAGYQALGLSGGGSPSAASIAASGAKFAGITATDSLPVFIAAGLKTLIYTINRRYLRDQFLSQGASGFFSDDPLYLRTNVAIAKTDFFARQTWASGMIGNDSDTGMALANRGVFSAPNYWGYSSSSAGYLACLHGYLCPVASPINFTFTFNAVHDSFNVGTSWMGIFIGTSDRPFQNGADASMGYHILIRPVSGTFQIYRKDNGAAATQLASVVGTAGSLAQEFTYQITITPTTITLARISGTNQFSVSATDAAYRGGYIQIGRDGIGGRFRNLQIA